MADSQPAPFARRMSLRHKTPGARLKHSVKELLFRANPTRASEVNKLRSVLSVFEKYEKDSQEPGASSGSDGAVFVKLLSDLDDRFKEDFPFYLILAHRVQNCSRYKGDEVNEFIKTCVEKFESLDRTIITETLNWFLNQEVTTYANSAAMTDVFVLLEEAFIGLMEKDNTKLCPHDFITKRMLWISCCLKCRSCKATVQGDVSKFWIEKLMWELDDGEFQFTMECALALGKGLEFGQKLELVGPLRFSNALVKALVEAGRAIKPFTDMRRIVETFSPYAESGEVFISMFLEHPVKCIQPVKADRRIQLSPDNSSSAVAQGLDYLEYVAKLYRTRGWNDNKLCEQLKIWLSLLIGLIDTKNEIDDLKVLLTRQCTVSEDMYDYIEEEIITQHKLSVQNVFSVHEVTLSPYKFVQNYLLSHKDDVCVSDPEWSSFFTQAMHKYPGFQDNRLLLDFLKSVSKCYQSRGEAKKFVLDLLHLNIGKNFSKSPKASMTGRDDADTFQSFLQNFVKENKLQEILFQESNSILDSIADENDFQSLVLDFLQREAILAAAALKGSIKSSMKSLLEPLYKSTDALHDSSAKFKFCWETVAACCKEMPITDDLTWARDFYGIVENLGWVFSTCCGPLYPKSEEQCPVFEADIPADVPNRTSVVTLSSWVQRARRVLHLWNENLKSKNLTSEDMSLYKTMYSFIKRGAIALLAEKLIITPEELKKFEGTHKAVSEKLLKYLICCIEGHPEIRWCALPDLFSKYDFKLPQDLLAKIARVVTFPSEELPFGEIKVNNLLKPTAKLNELESLLSHLEATLNPGLAHFSKLLFFYHSPSGIVSTCLRFMSQKQETQSTEIKHFLESFDTTMVVLADLVKGNMTYSRIDEVGLSNLGSFDFDYEFDVLDRYIKCVNPSLVSDEGLKKIKCMLQLFLLPKHTNTIKGVCEQYQLAGCISDPSFKQLVTLSADLSEESGKHRLTLENSLEMMDMVKKILCFDDKISWKFMELFSAVAESSAFYKFIVEDKEFVGEEGRHRFDQQYKLISSYLQHEEYNEVVCDHLNKAFMYILPFTDKKQDFHTLMKGVGQLVVADGCKPLQTVNRNVHLIQRWFSRLEKNQPPDVISAELESVLSTGRFEFTPGTSGPMAVILKFENSSCVTSSWSGTEIRKFVRDLQLSDPVEDSKKNVDHFLFLHETVQKLLKMHQELRALAHQDYLEEMNMRILSCNCTSKEAEEKVAGVAHLLQEWKKEVASIHKSFPQLLFFSMAKLVHLSQLLVPDETNVGPLVKEIGFLFQPKTTAKDTAEPNTANHIKELEEQVKVLLERSRREQNVGASVRTPLHTLGFVVSELMPKYGLRTRPRTHCVSPQSVLYACSGCSQRQIISLLVSIYGGAPEAYEVLHCQPSISKEELDRFINPSRHSLHRKHTSTYLLLEVNSLPCGLQEMLLQADKPRQLSNVEQLTSIGFVATGPSSLENMITYTKFYNVNSSSDIDKPLLDQLHSILRESISKLELVYGNAGDGKSWYIKGQLQTCPRTLYVVINEAFTISSAIEALNKQPLDESHCGIWFNFTLLPPGESVDETERKAYKELVNTIGWFFFRLLVIGYVEDPVSGKSFSLPRGFSLEVYVEVPSLNDLPAIESLQRFQDQMPTLEILAKSYEVSSKVPYEVDSNVRLVCRYLKALKTIKALRKEKTLDDNECQHLLESYIPDNMKKNKVLQKLFIQYMTYRCKFLDSCEDLLQDKPDLRAILFKTMLSEISGFCNCDLDKPYHQLVYDAQNKKSEIILMTPCPDLLSADDIDQFKKAEIRIPSVIELCQRDFLDKVLAQAIGLPLNDKHCLTVIDESSYVLTSDFVVKMLNIHERARCKVPVVIEGETGVGKTALIEMMSKLWNLAAIEKWNREKNDLLELIRNKVQQGSSEIPDQADGPLQITKELLCQIGNQQTDGTSDRFYKQIRVKILQMKSTLSLLEPTDQNEGSNSFFSQSDLNLWKDTSEATASLAYRILNARIKKTFHKLNVHSGLRPAHIKEFFGNIFKQAKEMQSLHTTEYESPSDDSRLSMHTEDDEYKTPFVTVFLDEVNTSSCLGLLKEIIVDRTLEGEPIPENVFLISACNPHHGNSSSEKSTWIRGTYYVRQLHPTLKCLTWDYGALGEKQEGDYFKAKVQLSSKAIDCSDIANFTSLVTRSQTLVRTYALKHLRYNYVESEATMRSKSCVSQRDIQRVFVLYEWLVRLYKECKPHCDDPRYSTKAFLMTLGLVYYIRLDAEYREKYQKDLDAGNVLAGGLSFIKTFNEGLEWFVKQVDFPAGIPRTQALKENLFAVVACTMTHTPLIVVGAPGTSNIAFDIALANFRGLQSKESLFQKTDIFRCLEQQFYQCSRHTTSDEISKVFSRAMNRQKNHASIPLPIYCVVFMNEAGFPEEKLESLKVLHYYLDQGEVSFVAISNHVLDAAKTNRAVTLYQPETSDDDLRALATEALDLPSLQLQEPMTTVHGFCSAYQKVMEDLKLKAVFGIQDFIHFMKNLHYHRSDAFSPDIVMKSLEENFNGVEPDVFNKICTPFLKAVNSSLKGARCRSLVDILRATLQARSSRQCAPHDLRYKMFIDPTVDGSLAQILLSCDVLKRSRTRVYMCSDFPGDTELQKIQNIKAIQHSMAQGHTVVLNQTDAINDSFYDVFSRRFEYIDKVGASRSYYATVVVGSHIRLCQVHPNFECILVVKKSEMERLPTAFLGLFEKYYLTHSSILEALKRPLPDQLKQAIQCARKEVEEFVTTVSTSNSIFGLGENTLDSILFSILPLCSHEYKEAFKPPHKSPDMDNHTFLLTLLLDTLRKNGGFRIPEFSIEEIAHDSRELKEGTEQKYSSILNDESFDGRNIAKVVSSGVDAMWTGRQIENDISLAKAPIIVKSVFQRWLAQYMQKCLLKLMVPEAIFKLQQKLTPSFIQYYFDCQHHFSLKSLINYHSNSLKTSVVRGSQVRKILCFTRSSDQLINQLPAHYPSKSRSSSPNAENYLLDLISDDLEGLSVHRVSPQWSSISLLHEDLTAFCQLDSMHTMLLVARFQEVSVSVIAHLRVMVEEAENTIKEGAKKLFVLLVQYPQMQSSRDTSHLSLFSYGWDLHYLDTIGCNAKTSVADVTEWLKSCCGVATPSNTFGHIKDGGVLQGAFEKVFSKLSLGSKSDRSAVIERILSKGVRDVLIEQFASYWNKNTAVSLLKETLDTCQDVVAVGLHDCIQSNLRNLFFNFVYHMALQMNQGGNLNLLVYDHHHPGVVSLFTDLLKVYPIPTLKELKVLQNPTPSREECPDVSPRFPFFSFVSSKVEEVVDSCRRQLNQTHYCRHRSGSQRSLSLLHTLDTEVAIPIGDIAEAARKLLEAEQSNSIMQAVLKALKTSEDLWVRYFEDFIHYRVQGDYDCGSPRMVESLEKTKSLSIPDRLTRLHAYFNVHRLNLRHVVSSLKPLDDLGAKDSSAQGPLTDSLVSSWYEEGGVDSSTGLGGFVVDSLFNAWLKIVKSDTPSSIMKWYQIYSEVILFPTLRQCLYRLQSNTATKFNLLHMVYILLGSSSPDPPDQTQIQTAADIFCTLNEQFSRSSTVPELKDVAVAALSDVPGNQDGRKSWLILEGLLDHYFAEERTFADSDCEWFMEMANKQQHWLPENISQTQESQSHSSCSLSVFKFHLRRLMRHYSPNKQDQNEFVFNLQSTQVHQMIAQILAKVTEATVNCYIPPFYAKCIKGCAAIQNSLMQQPLAYLYFVTAFERCLESGLELPALVRVTQQIRKRCEASTISINDRILLLIEEQATVQAVIQKLAKDFNLNDSDAQYNVLSSMLQDVNRVLDDDRTGGGHGLVLVMCMLSKLGSFGALRELLVNKYSILCEHINCLRPFHSNLLQTTQDQITPRALIVELGPDFERLYDRVSSALLEIHRSKNWKKLIELKKSSNAAISIQGSFAAAPHAVKELCGVRMAAWLCIFQDFWSKAVPSQNLMKDGEIAKWLGKDTASHIGRFLDVQPLSKKDSPKTHQHDPIMALFSPSTTGAKAQGLQKALLYFVTLALGSGATCWYQMFAKRLMELMDCHTSSNLPFGTEQSTGVHTTERAFEWSMSNSSLSPTRKPQNYSYPLQQFIMWVGYAGCCLWLLVNPTPEEHPIKSWMEKTFGSSQSVQQYCASKLKSVWEEMLGKLSISVEELVFLIKGVLFKLFEKKTSENMTEEGLQQCWERLLRDKVFEQQCNTLKNDFKKAYPMLQHPLLENISQLNAMYPWFPTDKTLSNALSVHSAGTSDPLNFLSKFICGYEQLQITGQILPGLLELYHWLHTELMYGLSSDEARSQTIGNIVKDVSRTHYFNGEETMERIKAAYNRYICLWKGEDKVKREQNQLLIETTKPLIDFLSVEEGLDLLYNVIINMVELHNSFIKLHSNKHLYLVPSTQLSQFNQSLCIVGSTDSDSLLELIRRRSYLSLASLPPSSSHTPSISSNLPGQMDALIDLAALQDDILVSCMAGKPQLNSSNLRTPFKFRESPTPEDNIDEQ